MNCRGLPLITLLLLTGAPAIAQTTLGAPAPSGAASVAPAPAAATAPTEATKPADKPWYDRLRVSGYMIGDAYLASSHHDPTIEGQSGFWLRRTYLTFDFAVAERWSGRFRLEANSPGDFKTNAKLDPFVKDAFLAWKGPNVDLLLGISPSPTFELIEAFWGYRAIEKTPLDLYRLAAAREFGLAARGKLAGGRVFYHATIGNGAGEGAETNEGKKAALAVGFRPTEELVVELYGDTEERPGSTDRTTYQAFTGWKGTSCRFGLQYASQDRQTESGADQTLAVGSAFGVFDLSPKSSLILRYDRAFDGNPEADKIPYLVLAKDFEYDLALLGFDWRLDKRISLIPNLEYVTYRDTDGRAAPDDDLIARMTLYFQF